MNVVPLSLFSDEESPSTAQDHLSKVCACRRRVFSTEEDRYLSELVNSKSCSNWFEISQRMPGRTARQCRDRWMNYLSPSNSFEPWTAEEDELIVQKVNEIGTRWAQIAKLIKGRSDNSVKNRWYSGLRGQCVQNPDGKYILVRGGQKRPDMQYAPQPMMYMPMQMVQVPTVNMMGMFPAPYAPPPPPAAPVKQPPEPSAIDKIFDKTIFSQVNEINQDPFADVVDFFAEWYPTYD